MNPRPVRILLVEDNPGDADLVREALADLPSARIDLAHAADLTTALRLATDRRIDVVLLDLALPDSQGMDTVTRMRGACPGVPVVVLTGLNDDEAAVEALRLGAQDYLVKGQLDGATIWRALRYAVERKRLEDQLVQAQKLEAVGRLAGGIAHDFNNLLTAILGFTDVLLHDADTSSLAHTGLLEIQKAGERAATLTQQLLAFGRKQMLRMKVMDLNAVVTEAAALLPGRMGHEVQLVTELGAEVPPVKADPAQLQQVILNLAVNAREAMPQGGKLFLSTEAVELGEDDERRPPELRPGLYSALTVRDTGCGMTPEVTAHLFEPFFTTREFGQSAGLGLATVHGIVKQCGGHVTVWSKPGQGTSFTVYLPAVKTSMEVVTRRVRPPELPRGEPTVLLVEDEPSVRTLIRMVLNQAGCTVLEASNGAEAKQMARSHPGRIELLVTDLVMPGMSGWELVEQLRQGRPGLAVLFITGYTEDPEVRRRLADGEAYLLPRPFSTAELGRLVQEILAHPGGADAPGGRQECACVQR